MCVILIDLKPTNGQEPDDIAACHMKISIVTTLFNSEPYVAAFYERAIVAASRITDDVELIFVNDGSSDRAMEILLEKQKVDRRIVIVDLSRNFGHHRALMTGLEQASGDMVFLCDSDLEEAPELIITLWEARTASEDIDVWYGVQDVRKGGWFEKLSGAIWYKLFALMIAVPYPANSATARLMTRRYVDAVLSHPERELELWGVFALTGFEQHGVEISKSHKGSSSYNLTRKLRMAVDSITSISSAPLVGLFVLGLFITAIAAAYIVYLLALGLIYDEIPEGWVTTVISIWFVGGLIIFSLGVIGIYLSKMFREIKSRPRTIIRKIYRVDP